MRMVEAAVAAVMEEVMVVAECSTVARCTMAAWADMTGWDTIMAAWNITIITSIITITIAISDESDEARTSMTQKNGPLIGAI
jgi:hypothetical protein